MNVALFLSKKLSLQQNDRSTSPGVIIAVTGIALSLIIMMISIAVVTGFKKEITDKLLGFNAPISLYGVDYNSADEPVNKEIELSESLRSKIQSVLPQAEPHLSIMMPAIFKTDSAFQGVMLRGLDDADRWRFAAANLEDGALPDSSVSDGIVISRSIASTLNLNPGDRILTHFLTGSHMKTRKYTVAGIYNSNFADYDRSIAFIDIRPLQQLLGIDSLSGSIIDIEGINLDDVPQSARELYNALMTDAIEQQSSTFYQVDTIYHNASVFFGWLDLLDTNVWVILILMLCVSSFTLISSLFIVMLQRVNTIGLLKALGSTNLLIRNTFIFLAMKIVLRGLMIGNLIGITALLLQHYFHLLPLDPETYYLNYVPVSINWLIILLLNIGVIFISWLILILPSYFISHISPAKAIRYE